MLIRSLTNTIEIQILKATTWWILNISSLFKHLTVGLTMRILIIWAISFTSSAVVAFIVTQTLF